MDGQGGDRIGFGSVWIMEWAGFGMPLLRLMLSVWLPRLFYLFAREICLCSW